MDVCLASTQTHRHNNNANRSQADETGSEDGFEAVGFKTVKHQRIPDNEMPDVLYSIQYCSSTGRLLESESRSHPLTIIKHKS